MNIFLMILFILITSLFNTFYKYMVVKNTITSFNNNIGFLTSAVSVSNTSVDYLKIFIYSLITLIIYMILLNLILYFINKKEFIKINFLPFIISIIVSFIALFINNIITYLVLIIGLFIFLFINYKKTNKLSFFILLLLTLILIYILYLISL